MGLQNERGRDRVAIRIRRSRRVQRRPPLVLEDDGHAGPPTDERPQPSHPSRHRTGRSIGIERQTEDDEVIPLGFDETGELIEGVFPPADAKRTPRSSEPSVTRGTGQAHASLAEVDTEELHRQPEEPFAPGRALISVTVVPPVEKSKSTVSMNERIKKMPRPRESNS